MLPDGETIHTFVNPAGMLVGADWTREQVIEAIQQFGAELSGGMATRMNHGMVLFRGDRIRSNALFIETKTEAALSAALRERAGGER